DAEQYRCHAGVTSPNGRAARALRSGRNDGTTRVSWYHLLAGTTRCTAAPSQPTCGDDDEACATSLPMPAPLEPPPCPAIPAAMPPAQRVSTCVLTPFERTY